VAGLKGGVAGGSILRGVLRVGMRVEVRPGIVTKDAKGKVKCLPIYSQINSLYAEHNDLQFAVPGGLIGVGTRIDPTLTRADRLVGQVGSIMHVVPPLLCSVCFRWHAHRPHTDSRRSPRWAGRCNHTSTLSYLCYQLFSLFSFLRVFVDVRVVASLGR
jgi:hypothetical protein